MIYQAYIGVGYMVSVLSCVRNNKLRNRITQTRTGQAVYSLQSKLYCTESVAQGIQTYVINTVVSHNNLSYKPIIIPRVQIDQKQQGIKWPELTRAVGLVKGKGKGSV